MKPIFSALSVAALLGGAATVAHAQDVGPTPPATEEAAPPAADPLDPNASDTLPPVTDELSPAPPADTVQPVDPDEDTTLPADDFLDQQDDTVTQDGGFGDPADSTLDHGAGHAGDEVEADLNAPL